MAGERTANQVPSLAVKSNAADDADVIVWGDPVTHRVLVDANATIASNSAVGDGSKDVTTAGTRVQLSGTSVSCKRVHIQAKVGNSGSIYVGGSTVATGRGIELIPLASITLNVSNLNLIYIDSSVNSEGVTYTYEN
jgi:hypothetical protein